MERVQAVGGMQSVFVSFSESILSQELDGEIVLLNLDTGEYYGLNEVGSSIWSLLREHKRSDTILPALLEMYDVPRDVLEADIQAFLTDLAAHQLVTFHEEDV